MADEKKVEYYHCESIQRKKMADGTIKIYKNTCRQKKKLIGTRGRDTYQRIRRTRKQIEADKKKNDELMEPIGH